MESFAATSTFTFTKPQLAESSITHTNVNVCMHECMHGRMAGWLGGRAGGWVDGWMDVGMYIYACYKENT